MKDIFKSSPISCILTLVSSDGSSSNFTVVSLAVFGCTGRFSIGVLKPLYPTGKLV
nr:MAG: hypothetical protein [Bacteriophage sp.]